MGLQDFSSKIQRKRSSLKPIEPNNGHDSNSSPLLKMTKNDRKRMYLPIHLAEEGIEMSRKKIVKILVRFLDSEGVEDLISHKR